MKRQKIDTIVDVRSAKRYKIPKPIYVEHEEYTDIREIYRLIIIAMCKAWAKDNNKLKKLQNSIVDGNKEKKKYIRIEDVIDLCEDYLANSPIEYTPEEILYDLMDQMQHLQKNGEPF